MSRHLRLSHTLCQCFWQCPVPTFPMWFASELNGKDHLKRIHNFTEGRGYSFYECLRQFGLEWFGRRSFFDQREVTGQALWMDLALARHFGQELHNDYVLTTSPAFGNLRKFFFGAIQDPVLAYDEYPGSSVAPAAKPSICDRMRQDMDAYPQGSPRTSFMNPVVDIPVVESLIISSSTPPPPVVDAPVRSFTPNNRSLGFLQSGPLDHPQLHVPLSRGQFQVFLLAAQISSTMLNRFRLIRCSTMMSRQYAPGQKQHETNFWLWLIVILQLHDGTCPT